MVISPQHAIDNGWISFPEEPMHPNQLQPNGIDIRLKIAWKVPIHATFKMLLHKTVHLNKYLCEKSISRDSPTFLFDRGFAYVMESFEFVRIPENVIAFIYGRSSLNRNGVFCRASVYDSGFKDFVGCSLFPFVPFEAHFGVRLAQIVFMEADSCHLYDGQYVMAESVRRSNEEEN